MSEEPRGGPGRLAVLDDPTSLNGPRIDVAVRVGWLLRMARLSRPHEPLIGLEDMARRLSTSAARLHRIETGAARSGVVAAGYEAQLGLEDGALRAPIDILCRGFPYSPPDTDSGPQITDVRSMSRLTDEVSSPDATGGTWLRWARGLAQPGAIGMPETIAHDLVTKLISELNRSVSHGYPTRYEALALLRCSAYGGLVLESAQDLARDPHVQVLFDVMSAVGERPSDNAVAWCMSLLDLDDERLLVGGALALENMGEVMGHADFWPPLLGGLLDKFDEVEPGSTREEWLAHLIRLVPAAAAQRQGRLPRRPLPAGAHMPNWSRTRRNAHWSECQSRSHTITQALGVADQPVLSRLLFDIAMSPHESRAVTSYMLIGALPHLRRLVGEQLADIAETHSDPVVRDRSARRLAGTLQSEWNSTMSRWLTSDDGQYRDRALRAAGAADVRVDTTVLRTAIRDGGTTAALYAAGMTGHPFLTDLAHNRSFGADVRGGAAWWLAQGRRIAR